MEKNLLLLMNTIYTWLNRWFKKYYCFPYWATLINNGIFFTTKDSFAKFQNITKGIADAALEYFLCGFVGHFKIKHVFCKKTYKKSLKLGGKIRAAAFKLVSTKSFVFLRLKV